MPAGVTAVAQTNEDSRRLDILSGQIRLLYANASVSGGVTILAASILVALQWDIVPKAVSLGWWLFMTAVSAGRFVLARRYMLALPRKTETSNWLLAFSIGAGLAGAGWGLAGILLYPQAHLANQVFLVFVLGGMMLGAASLLAPRPEAFLAFMIPTGLGPAIRFLLQGDETHVAMGLLAAVFTLALVVTAHRTCQTIHSSLSLQFENRELLENLLAAKDQAEALNQALELRVQERTAELRESTSQLLAEIAQREQMEEELLRGRKLESLAVLAGGIAHDFNNFLTVVQGNIELAKALLPATSPVQQNLDQTAEACLRATFLSSQLLTFAKGGAPVRRVASVAKLVADAIHLARAGTPITVSAQIADDLHFAEVDPGQIGQVLHNILLNARQSMPEGGIIEVRAGNAAGNRVHIAIRDYGCGIPADVLPRIFDPYFTTKPTGSGLGLATAYAIVSKHGGHIEVDSKPGGGTLFLIDLPACQQEPAAEAPAPVETERGRERILVMDDEEAVRNLLKTVLVSFGYDVQTARDGAEAVALCEGARNSGICFDAALLDLTVRGGMGGVEAAARLKEIEPSIKLIVSSGYADAPAMSDFASYGFDGVIPKPWTSTEITEALRKVLATQPNRTTD